MNQTIVTETTGNIRALARVALRGKWKLAAISTAVYMVALSVPASILDIIFGGPDGISMLSGIYTCLVAGPFTIGYSLFCMNLFRQKECEVAQVFYGFERFVKALGLYFVMVLFVMLWSLLFIIPGIIAAFRYSQCFLIMVDHPEYGIMQCISESKRLMVGNKMKYFCMELSFFGWALLATIPTMAITTIFAFGGVVMMNIGAIVGSVAYFWLTPYMSVAGVAFYELLTGNLQPGVIDVQPIDVQPLNVPPVEVQPTEVPLTEVSPAQEEATEVQPAAEEPTKVPPISVEEHEETETSEQDTDEVPRD